MRTLKKLTLLLLVMALLGAVSSSTTLLQPGTGLAQSAPQSQDQEQQKLIANFTELIKTFKEQVERFGERIPSPRTAKEEELITSFHGLAGRFEELTSSFLDRVAQEEAKQPGSTHNLVETFQKLVENFSTKVMAFGNNLTQIEETLKKDPFLDKFESTTMLFTKGLELFVREVLPPQKPDGNPTTNSLGTQPQMNEAATCQVLFNLFLQRIQGFDPLLQSLPPAIQQVADPAPKMQLIKSYEELLKSLQDLIKSWEEIAKSCIDLEFIRQEKRETLLKSVADLLKSQEDLAKSRWELIKLPVGILEDLLKSFEDLLKSLEDLIKSLAELLKL